MKLFIIWRHLYPQDSSERPEFCGVFHGETADGVIEEARSLFHRSEMPFPESCVCVIEYPPNTIIDCRDDLSVCAAEIWHISGEREYDLRPESILANLADEARGWEQAERGMVDNES